MPLPAGGAFLATTVRVLLQGITAAVADSCISPQARGQPATRALHGSAACCLDYLTLWLAQQHQHEAARDLPTVAAAVELASLLINGGHTSTVPRECSCCLAGGSGSGSGRSDALPILAPGRAGRSMPIAHWKGLTFPTAHYIYFVLKWLAVLQVRVIPAFEVGARELQHASVDLLASKGGHLLLLQQIALSLAEARHCRAATAVSSATAAGGVIPPACADLKAFLGQVDGRAMAALQGMMLRQSPAVAFEAPLLTCRYMFLFNDVRHPACDRCWPQQLMLAVEAATTYPVQGAQHSMLHQLLSVMDSLMQLHASQWQAWMPAAFMARALPSFVAWVPAAAQQLRTCWSGGAAAAPRSSYNDRELACAVLHVAGILLMQPGGLLHPTPCHPEVLEQLVACAELALRLPCPNTAPEEGDFHALAVELGVGLPKVGAAWVRMLEWRGGGVVRASPSTHARRATPCRCMWPSGDVRRAPMPQRQLSTAHRPCSLLLPDGC